ncbi:MAG: beta-N-acetylhexosaminidase [Myxococcota bacterium]
MNKEELAASYSIIVGISGTTLTDEERRFLSEFKPLGVILFKRNYENPKQLLKLVNSIKESIERDKVIVCVDQEGGRVQRFTEPFTIIPSAEVIGSTENEYLATEVGKIIAKEILACGVNMNLSPVCDINTNPQNKVISDRAYGKTADIVMRMSESVMYGLSQGGVLTCAKHFPGHGDTSVDSHETLPVSQMTIEGLYQRELLPFINISEKGVDAIMLAHILYEKIDSEFPASLSERLISLLRMEIGFEGIIMSDDMEMKAISNLLPVPDAALKAVENQADVVLICHTLNYQIEAYQKIKRYYLDNPEKIETKLCRMNKFLSSIKESDYEPDIIGCKEHKDIIREVIELSNT